MVKAKQFFVLLVLWHSVTCDADEIKCPESTRPHKTECIKYYKCIRLPSNTLSWVVLTCQEGLVYDKNLRSCAIPPENWDCNLNSEEIDDDETSNVFGIQTFSNSEEDGDDSEYMRHDSDEFLEIIDGEKDLENLESRSEDSADYSGDGGYENFVTPSTVSAGMVTTQIQRLSQLIKNIPKTNDEITAHDLNTYLATQNIQSKLPSYQKNSYGKTTIPVDGKVHPEIQEEIIMKQNEMNLKSTTLAMDETTTPSAKPIFFIGKEPVTEIKLKSALDGTGSHQIVVNRPEGSVLFNVPVANDNDKSESKPKSPYMSEDILKTILEISKQMVIQKSTNQDNNHPVYYALPIPIIPPQNHVQNYYGSYPNTTESPEIITEKIPYERPTKNVITSKQKNRINVFENLFKQHNNYEEATATTHSSGYGTIDQFLPQQKINSQYPSTKDNYQNYNNQYPYYYSPYNPLNYHQFYNSIPYYQYSQSNEHKPQKNFNQFSNYYDSAYYENRPFVSDSSAPFVDHSYPIRKKPYQKESFESYENDYDDASDDESDDDHEKLEDESTEDDEPKGPTDGLICTFALARQANKTDCFKYYVCNAKTKEVLSYTCPVFTAFNDQTKYCDSDMYKACKKSQDSLEGSLKNSKIYKEAHKALQQVKKESEKVERIANLVKKQSQRIIYDRNQQEEIYENESVAYKKPLQIQTYQKPFQPQSYQRPTKPVRRRQNRPKIIKRKKSSVAKPNTKRRKKSKVKCIAPGNIADPEDKFSYWHCFKSPDGRMKRIHKKCSSNLRFCAVTTYCSPRC